VHAAERLVRYSTRTPSGSSGSTCGSSPRGAASARGLEGQALKWVHVARLPQEDHPRGRCAHRAQADAATLRLAHGRSASPPARRTPDSLDLRHGNDPGSQSPQRPVRLPVRAAETEALARRSGECGPPSANGPRVPGVARRRTAAVKDQAGRPSRRHRRRAHDRHRPPTCSRRPEFAAPIAAIRPLVRRGARAGAGGGGRSKAQPSITFRRSSYRTRWSRDQPVELPLTVR